MTSIQQQLDLANQTITDLRKELAEVEREREELWNEARASEEENSRLREQIDGSPDEDDVAVIIHAYLRSKGFVSPENDCAYHAALSSHVHELEAFAKANL